MSRIKGKKPTLAQFKALKKEHPLVNTEEYLYYGEESVSDDGSKCTSKNASKQKYYKFIHRETGEILKAPF